MASKQARIKQLEKASAANGGKYKYACVIGLDCWDTPEEKELGFKIQPYLVTAGGTGGEPFYLKTQADLDKFAARDDVELCIITIEWTDDKNITNGE